MFSRSSKSKTEPAQNGSSSASTTKESDFESAFVTSSSDKFANNETNGDGSNINTGDTSTVPESSDSYGLDDIDNETLPFTIVNMDGQQLQLQFAPEQQGGALLMRLSTSEMNTVDENGVDSEAAKAQVSQKIHEMDILRDMGITVQASVSKPFIGLLVVRVKGIRDWKGRKNKVHIQTIFESDKSKAVPSSPESKRGNIMFTEDATFGFVRIFSKSNLTFVVKDKNPGPRIATSILAGVELSLTGLREGNHDISVDITRQDRRRTKMGVLDIQIDYRFLRGTKDNGDYDGPDRIYVEPRRMRAKLNINSGVQYISNVNHWLMSHDNIFCASEPASIECDENQGSSSQLLGSASAGLQSAVQKNTFWECNSLKGQQAFSEGQEAAKDKVFNSNLMDALQPQKADTENMQELKEKLLACMVMFCERISTLEQQQAQMIEVIKQLSGQSENSQSQASVEPHISGRFEYGFGRPGKDRLVSIVAAQAPNAFDPTPSAHFLGNYHTDAKGLLTDIGLPDSIIQNAGHYNVLGFLPEDNTFAKGSLFMLKRGTPCVVFDLDGTITVGDKEVVTQFALNALGGSLALGDHLPKNYDLKPRHHALTIVRMWAAKGYQPIYLSGRQGSFYNLTLEWLLKHGYPPGPIHLTRTHMPTLPVYYSVGNFKVAYIETLKARGLQIYAAYGNTGTDVRAYEAVGIPKERTFIVGPNGGKGGTVRVDDFTEHVLEIMKHPDADPAIPYTELLYAQLPAYRRSGGRRRSNVVDSFAGNMPTQDQGMDTVDSNQSYYGGQNQFKNIETFADSEFQEEEISQQQQH